jgi:hypothetical protein
VLSDAIEFLSSPGRFDISATYITAFLKMASVYYMFKYIKRTRWKSMIPKSAFFLFSTMVIWNVITIIRGAVASKDYWDWKFLILTNSFNFLIPYAIVFGVTFIHNVRSWRFIMNDLFKYGFYLLPLALTRFGTLYTILMYPVALFTLFSAYFTRKPFLLVMAVVFFSVGTGFEIRANLIRVLVPCLLLMVYYFRSAFKKGWIKFICYPFFFLPMILLFLGVTGIFNVFKPFEGNARNQVVTNSETGDLTQDTRTGLYQEVFLSMNKRSSFLFGEGGSAKYESATFDNLNDGRGRYGAEVGFLNSLLYSGIVGVFLYMIILITACNYAINRSNNFLCKLLAIFLAFRWVLFFIEDIPKYNLNFFFLWIAIGLCFSTEFRSLTDAQLKAFFKTVTKNTKTIKVPELVS